jgi:hypothetical protein
VKEQVMRSGLLIGRHQFGAHNSTRQSFNLVTCRAPEIGTACCEYNVERFLVAFQQFSA